METKVKAKGKARFDTRLSQDQKELFEYAARLGGFRSLTDFVVLSAQEKAKKIINEYKTILGSERDREVFFDAVLKAEDPNELLKKTADRYIHLLEDK